MAILLPTKKSEKDLAFTHQKFAMIGAAGIGKSEFWAQDPKALFIEAERGLNHLEVLKVPCTSWDDLRDVYAELKKLGDTNFPYSVVVFDTIDRVIDYAEEEIIMRAKKFYKNIADEINCIADIPNGGGWSKSKEIVLNLLNKFDELPCAVAYIGHLSVKRIKQGAVESDRSTISIGGKLGEELLAWPDHTLHVETILRGDKKYRTVWTMPTQSREAKSRGSVIKDGWTWDEDMKKNYEYFRNLFK